MAKSFFKTDNKFLWGGIIAAIGFLLFFVFKRREGFQGTQTVAVGPAVVVPPIDSNTGSSSSDIPNMDSISMDILKSGSTSDLPTLPNPSGNTTKLTLPMITTKPSPPTKPTVVAVRAKLNELKSLVDSM